MRRWKLYAPLLLAAACIDPTRGTPCGDPVRVTISEGRVVDPAGAVIAMATLGVGESELPGAGRVTLSLFGPGMLVAGPLRGHVRSVRIVDASGRVVFAPDSLDQIPASEPGGGALVRGITLAIGDDVARSTRDLLIANTLVVEIETDYPGAEHLRLPLLLEQAGDFQRVICV